jgi:nicotinamide/nicotinate riboside kinase
MNAFADAIRYIRENDGRRPPNLNSIQDKNELGEPGVPDDLVQIMHKEFVSGNLKQKGNLKVCFVDGFLLYNDPALVKGFDVRLLVRAPYEKLKARREARSGYVTLEGQAWLAEGLTIGFWEDPPGYFDKIVWKSYVGDHKHLFENADINGPLREENPLNLQTPVQLDLSMQELLMWAIGVVSDYLQNIE